MENKIDAIYKKIANKELSFGCKVKFTFDSEPEINITIVHNRTREDLKRTKELIKDFKERGFGTGILTITNIGHPVMVGDVLDYFYNNYTLNNIGGCEDCNIIRPNITTAQLWKEKRKPIEEQSEECIDYIYNLIKND